MKCSRKASAGIPSGLFRCKSGVIIVILILPYLEHLSYLHQFDARFTYLGQLVYLPISSSRAFIVNSLINSNLAIKFYRKLISIDHLGLVKKLNTYLPNFRCVSALSIFLKSQTFRWFNCEINWRKAYFKFKTTWGDNVSPNLVTLVNTISLSYTKYFMARSPAQRLRDSAGFDWIPNPRWATRRRPARQRIVHKPWKRSRLIHLAHFYVRCLSLVHGVHSSSSIVGRVYRYLYDSN